MPLPINPEPGASGRGARHEGICLWTLKSKLHSPFCTTSVLMSSVLSMLPTSPSLSPVKWGCWEAEMRTDMQQFPIEHEVHSGGLVSLGSHPSNAVSTDFVCWGLESDMLDSRDLRIAKTYSSIFSNSATQILCLMTQTGFSRVQEGTREAFSPGQGLPALAGGSCYTPYNRQT